MRVVLILFLMIFITGCDPPYTDTSYLPTMGTLVNEVTNRTFVQLKMEKGLYPFGVGEGISDQIRMLALSLRYYKEIDIEEARELLMAAGVLFLKNINSNEMIRPYLKNDPFKPENVEIRIFLKKPNGSEPDFNKLKYISITDGTLKYYTNSPETECLIRIYDEKFEEAEAKLGAVVDL
jgi:hypothetical protein